MHQALHVSEVLLDIFVHVNQIVDLSSTRERSLSRRSLAALATTCKTFHEPAMDLLWADLVEIEPLLGCVTRLHPSIYLHGARSFRSEGVEPLSEHEACQFLRHASRVRSLYISWDEHFRLLTNLPNEMCMFPRLLSLMWDFEDTNNRYLHLFLSPMLLHCSIMGPHPALKSIGTRCATLERLSTSASDFDDVSVASTFDPSLLTEAVRSCKRLKHLECPPLEWEAWSHLSNLHTLLTVDISGEAWPLDRPNVEFAPFLNVTRLSFHIATAAYAITAMQHWEFLSLKEFTVHVRHGLPYAETVRLFRTLSQCKACQTLERIYTYSPRSVDQEPPLRPDNSSTLITQLLCFTQLRTLWLKSDDCFIYLDNDLLLKAMSSWPHMRRMNLTGRKHPPTITFRGLFAALRQCPHLHYLKLPIDAVNIDIDPKAESFQHNSLQTLDTSLSDVADAEAVACIIFSVLPCVDQVQYPTEREYEASPWHEVNRLLKSFKSSAVLSRHIAGAAPAT
ncbi:hypothetical protein DFH29DRAFT_465446 [Suillus ampliporus]|nr:hypothetical protein DFH29DRAFT_465446 [Suillus ampliporus]